MKRIYALLLIILLLATSLFGCAKDKESPLTSNIITKEDAGLIMHFIDVGQGDSTLIESKGEFALIDGGEYSERNKVISYLSSQGVDELEFIISTHPHSDHCGGLSEVIRNFNTKSLICPKVDTDSNAWEYVLDVADERGVEYITPAPNDKFNLGSATITIYSPDIHSIYSNLNDYSVVCKAEYGNTSFLLTGDAEKIVENELLRSGYDLSADILKCGHHGSSTSSDKKFVEAVNPAAAIISCGKNNDYGHPHEETLSTLSKLNIPVYRTDKEGTICVSTNGEKLYISTNEYSTLPVSTAAETIAEAENASYIGNKNSKVFHESICSSVNSMSDKNKISFASREEAESEGYTPCGRCKP